MALVLKSFASDQMMRERLGKWGVAAPVMVYSGRRLKKPTSFRRNLNLERDAGSTPTGFVSYVAASEFPSELSMGNRKSVFDIQAIATFSYWRRRSPSLPEKDTLLCASAGRLANSGVCGCGMGKVRSWLKRA